jgi:hypothetical protein
MASLARSLATMASQRRPQPCHFLSRHLIPLCRLQISLRQIQRRPIRGQPFRPHLAQRIARARSRQMPLLRLPQVKAPQRTHRLQVGLKNTVVITSPQSLSHPSLDVRIAQRKNLLGHYSSKSSIIMAERKFPNTRSPPDLSAQNKSGMAFVTSKTNRYLK